MPIARSAIVIASVPLPTPITWRTPRYSANSRSNASTSGPRMNAPRAMTSVTRPRISSCKGAWGVAVSNSGIAIVARTLTTP